MVLHKKDKMMLSIFSLEKFREFKNVITNKAFTECITDIRISLDYEQKFCVFVELNYVDPECGGNSSVDEEIEILIQDPNELDAMKDVIANKLSDYILKNTEVPLYILPKELSTRIFDSISHVVSLYNVRQQDYYQDMKTEVIFNGSTGRISTYHPKFGELNDNVFFGNGVEDDRDVIIKLIQNAHNKERLLEFVSYVKEAFVHES